jgi:hypothetical protein
MAAKRRHRGAEGRLISDILISYREDDNEFAVSYQFDKSRSNESSGHKKSPVCS